MNNTLLMVQYDGTAFSGWQHQPSQRTVQGVLAEAVEAMVRHPVELFASSRTDRGVHAREMPVSFESPRAIAPLGYVRGLNSLLPRDVSVLSARPVPEGFRPRDAAVAKTYVYRYQLGHRRALTARYAWTPRREDVDVDAMREAAAAFIGEHDFRAFRSVHCDARSTTRRIYTAHLDGPDDTSLIRLEIVGNAFLRNMVRIMAGALLTVGLGRRPPSFISEMLATGVRDEGAQTAPAEGLTLERVHFDGFPRLGKRPLPPLSPSPGEAP